jgi:acid phosphatase (class A)
VNKVACCIILGLTLAPWSAFSLSDKPYITAADVDFARLLPPPPSQESPAGKRDLQTILDLQKNMTPERLAVIKADEDQTVFHIAGEVLGPKFTKENFPMTEAFFDKVRKDLGAAGVGPIKQKYERPRPWQASKDVKQMSPGTNRSYPSGHSTSGAFVAILMSMMVPEKREALYARGWEFGMNRITSGTAHPSDWETAHILATLAVNQMTKNPEFRTDFEQVKAEVRKGLGLP